MNQITFSDLADETLVCLTKAEIEDIISRTVRATIKVLKQEPDTPTFPDTTYYNPAKTARLLNVTYGTITHWIEIGLLSAIRLDGHYYIAQTEINRILEQRKAGTLTGPRPGRPPKTQTPNQTPALTADHCSLTTEDSSVDGLKTKNQKLKTKNLPS